MSQDTEKAGASVGATGFQAALRWISAVCLVGMLAMVCAVILLRVGVIDVSFGWSDEIIELLFAWMVFLGTAIVWSTREHIVVDLIPQMLAGTRAAQVLEVIASVLCLVFLALFTWYGWLFTLQARGNTSPMLILPRELWYIAMPIAGVMMIWHTLRQGLAAIRRLGCR